MQQCWVQTFTPFAHVAIVSLLSGMASLTARVPTTFETSWYLQVVAGAITTGGQVCLSSTPFDVVWFDHLAGGFIFQALMLRALRFLRARLMRRGYGEESLLMRICNSSIFSEQAESRMRSSTAPAWVIGLYAIWAALRPRHGGYVPAWRPVLRRCLLWAYSGIRAGVANELGGWLEGLHWVRSQFSPVSCLAVVLAGALGHGAGRYHREVSFLRALEAVLPDNRIQEVEQHLAEQGDPTDRHLAVVELQARAAAGRLEWEGQDARQDALLERANFLRTWPFHLDAFAPGLVDPWQAAWLRQGPPGMHGNHLPFAGMDHDEDLVQEQAWRVPLDRPQLPMIQYEMTHSSSAAEWDLHQLATVDVMVFKIVRSYVGQQDVPFEIRTFWRCAKLIDAPAWRYQIEDRRLNFDAEGKVTLSTIVSLVTLAAIQALRPQGALEEPPMLEHQLPDGTTFRERWTDRQAAHGPWAGDWRTRRFGHPLLTRFEIPSPPLN